MPPNTKEEQDSFIRRVEEVVSAAHRSEPWYWRVSKIALPVISIGLLGWVLTQIIELKGNDIELAQLIASSSEAFSVQKDFVDGRLQYVSMQMEDRFKGSEHSTYVANHDKRHLSEIASLWQGIEDNRSVIKVERGRLDARANWMDASSRFDLQVVNAINLHEHHLFRLFEHLGLPLPIGINVELPKTINTK